MEIGLVGLPNAGKSTLFNAITRGNASTAGYAFTTIDPNVGTAEVPDAHFERLVKLMRPKKRVPAVVKVVDIAGLVEGASNGEGLGNQFLGHIREVDAIAQVVKCFTDKHVDGSKQHGPLNDIETINTELALADISTCEKRALKLKKEAKSGNKESIRKAGELDQLMEQLMAGKLARNFSGIADFRDLHLLTAKPMLLIANIGEDDFRKGNYSAAQPVIDYGKSHNSDTVIVSAKIEEELAELDDEEAEIFRSELAIDSTAMDQLIKASYHTLGLMSFFTASSDECRAWTLKRGSKAVDAAATIHTDFAKGFVKAEVIFLDQLEADGSYERAKELGHIQLEGKDYEVRDRDVIRFKSSL